MIVRCVPGDLPSGGPKALRGDRRLADALRAARGASRRSATTSRAITRASSSIAQITRGAVLSASPLAPLTAKRD